MKTLSLRRCHLFAQRGFWGVQVPGWQVDLSDHRKHPPLFSVRELGHRCGRHFGHYCLRAGRTVTPSQADRQPHPDVMASSAQKGTPDLATSTPDCAVDVAGTTGPTS